MRSVDSPGGLTGKRWPLRVIVVLVVCLVLLPVVSPTIFFWLYDVKGHYGYSNRINYLLLAELIEALSGDHIPQRDAWGIGE
jgi:hypothetical protein